MTTNNKLRLDKDGVPYAVCPKCKSKIYYLLKTDTIYIRNAVYLTRQGKIKYKETERDEAWEGYKAQCPECHQIIADTEEEVEALFQKKPLIKWEV